MVAVIGAVVLALWSPSGCLGLFGRSGSNKEPRKKKNRGLPPPCPSAATRKGGAGRGWLVDPGTHTAYVANGAGNNTVSVIDGSTRTVTATVRVGDLPEGVAVDLGTHTVYVVNWTATARCR